MAGTEWRSGPGFRQLLLARLVSQASDGAFVLCLAGFVIFSPEKAPTAGRLAADLAAVLLPYSLLGPFSGIVIDRVSRRDLLVGCALVRVALCLAVAGLLAAGGSTSVIVVAVLVLGVSRFVLSALSASLPATVPSADLVPAGSLATTSGTAASLAGGGVALLARLVVGSGPGGLARVAGLAAVGYLAAAAVAARPRRLAFGPTARKPWGRLGAEARVVVADATEGARYLWSRHPARDALIAVNASRLCYGFVFVTLLLVLRHGKATGIGSVGAVAAGIATGTVAAAFATPPMVRRTSREQVIAAALGLAGVAVAGLCTSLRPVLFVLASLILGFGTQAAKICSDALIQTSVDDVHRGRAFTLLDMSFNVSYVSAAFIAFLVLPAGGRSPGALLVAGLLWSVAGAAYAWSSSSRRVVL